MSAPLGIIDLTIDLSPTVTAAVAGIYVGIADSDSTVRKGRGIAEAVADTVIEDIVRVDDRPIRAVIVRDAGIFLGIVAPDVIEQLPELLLLGHAAGGDLRNELERLMQGLGGFAADLGRLAVDDVPVLSLVGNTVTIAVVDRAGAACIAVAVSRVTDDSALHDLAVLVVIIGFSVLGQITAAE